MDLSSVKKEKRFAKDATAKVIIPLLRYLLLIGLAFVVLYPLIYMLCISFREPTELLDLTVVWISKTFTFENIKTVFGLIEYPRSLLRTLSISLLCSVLQCFTASVTGYGFARFKFKGRNLLFFCAIFTFIVPPQIIMMPSYINYVNFTDFTGIKIINTIIPLALPALLGTGLRAGLFVVIFRQFYKNMPPELEEAAYIDGCTPIRAYWKVILANAGSILLVCFLFSFVWYWNDYFNVTLYFTEARPLSARIANFAEFLYTARSKKGVPYTGQEVTVFTQTACLMFILPVLALYVVLQKKFTQSIINAGIVG